MVKGNNPPKRSGLYKKLDKERQPEKELELMSGEKIKVPTLNKIEFIVGKEGIAQIEKMCDNESWTTDQLFQQAMIALGEKLNRKHHFMQFGDFGLSVVKACSGKIAVMVDGERGSLVKYHMTQKQLDSLHIDRTMHVLHMGAELPQYAMYVLDPVDGEDIQLIAP